MWKLRFSNLDPSVAFAFLCRNEDDFKCLIQLFKEKVLCVNQSSPLFEVYEKRPSYDVNINDFEDSNRSDDEFVLI